MSNLIDQWVRSEIRSLSAYHVADSKNMVKLDAMENPYTWPDELKQQWRDGLSSIDVNRYPDPQASALKVRLREYMGLGSDASLLLGNGSDELIQMLAMTVSGPDRSILSVEPGFVMYRMIATFAGMKYHGLPLRGDDFSLDTEHLLEAIARHRPALVFLAYPNNPTGNLFEREAVEAVIAAAPGMVVVDEAYSPFTDDSFVADIGRYDNLLVMSTLSKMGLAGLRLGMLAGPDNWLEQIEKTRLPYNINVLTQFSVAFALENQAVFDRQTGMIRAARDRMFQLLDEMEGIDVYPSDANFLLLRTAEGEACRIFEALKASGVLIKLLHGAHPLLNDCLRVTIGRDDENGRFLESLAEAL